MTEEAARAQAPVTVEFSAARKIDKRSEGRVELGAAVPSAYLHRDLGVWPFFERKRTSRGFSYDPCRILELLVWDRIAHPSSKRAAREARARFPRKCGFTADDVYRCLTYLDENADALVGSMNASLEESREPRDASCLYYDVTNYYFECDEEDGFRMRGVSKEHRPSPIVQMGLGLDSDGLPLGYELFPGNRNDMTTLLPSMSKAGVRDLPWGERVVVVAGKASTPPRTSPRACSTATATSSRSPCARRPGGSSRGCSTTRATRRAPPGPSRSRAASRRRRSTSRARTARGAGSWCR